MRRASHDSFPSGPRFDDPIVTFMEHAPFAVTLLDAQLRLCGYNQRARQLYRDRVPPLGSELGAFVRHIWPDANADDIVARFQHTLATGEPYAPPVSTSPRILGAPPEAHEWQIQRVRWLDDLPAIACYARDITLARRAEALIATNAANEAWYRTLFESIDEGFALVDVLFDAHGRPEDLRVLETNPAFDRQSGTSGLAGHTVLARFPTFERHWIEEFGRVAQTGESARLEGTVEPLERWFEVLAARVGNDDSRRIAIIFKDVSQRKRAEAALRASEAKHAYLLKLSDALRSLTDPVAMQFVAARVLGTHLAVSQAVYAEVESLEDSDYYIVGPSYCASGVVPISGRFRAQDYGPARVDEFHRGAALVVADVRTHPNTRDHVELFFALGIQSYIAAPLIKHGRHVALIGVYSGAPRAWSADDIALVEATGERTWAEVERARAEARQHETEARLQLALEASDMGVFVWHVEDDRGEPDARTLKLFGLAETDTLTFVRVIHQLTHPMDRTRLADAVAAAAEPTGARILREDFRVVHADGSVHWLAATGRMLFDEEAKSAVRLVGMLADVTERKSIEAALREREDLLKEGDRRKDEFIAILAHELRTPLAPIRTGLELIRMADVHPEEIENVRTMMERQVAHMVRLIDDLLDVSRIRSGKIRLRRQPTSLATLVHMAVDANRAAINERQIALRVGLPEESLLLDVDPTRFVQILSNVLNNAVKFTDPNGRIEIKTLIEQAETSGERAVVLTVTDTGVGMSREMLSRVFELFSQGDDTQRSQAGLGIGLALSRRLVELHGGSIEARSEGIGHGSAFTIRLPLRTRLPDVRPSTQQVITPKLGRRVVVIDDNVDAANSLRMFVSALGGDCRVAYDGQRGLAEVLEFRPHVILLDLGMPRMDGFETCRQIRHALGPGVVVVAITGWGQDQDKKAAMRAGFDAHLTKPVDPNVLKGLLQRVEAATS